MTEAIFTLGIFAIPVLVGAIAEQRKQEKQRKERELALKRDLEQIVQFKHGMAYRDECFKRSVLNTERQQVDKEEKQYARTVD